MNSLSLTSSCGLVFILLVSLVACSYAHIDSVYYVDMPRDCVVSEIGYKQVYLIEPIELHCELLSNVELLGVGTTLVVGRKANEFQVERVFQFAVEPDTNSSEAYIYASRHLESMKVELSLVFGVDTIALADTTSPGELNDDELSQFALLEMDPTLTHQSYIRSFPKGNAARWYRIDNRVRKTENLQLLVRYSLFPRKVPNGWARQYVYRLTGDPEDSLAEVFRSARLIAPTAAVTFNANANGALFATVVPELFWWQQLFVVARAPVLIVGVLAGILLFPFITSVYELKFKWASWSLLIIAFASIAYLTALYHGVKFTWMYDVMDGHYNWDKHVDQFDLLLGTGAFGAAILAMFGLLLTINMLREGQIRRNRMLHEFW